MFKVKSILIFFSKIDKFISHLDFGLDICEIKSMWWAVQFSNRIWILIYKALVF